MCSDSPLALKFTAGDKCHESYRFLEPQALRGGFLELQQFHIMFLCPRCIVSRSLRPNIRGILSPAPFQRPLSALSTRTSRLAQQPSIANRRNFQATAKQLDTSTETKTPPTEPLELDKELLPICCPGCGAYSQTIDPNEPGYYSKTRKKTRKVLNKTKRLAEERDKLLLSPAIETSTGNQDAESASGTRAVEDTAPKPARKYILYSSSLGLVLFSNQES